MRKENEGPKEERKKKRRKKSNKRKKTRRQEEDDASSSVPLTLELPAKKRRALDHGAKESETIKTGRTHPFVTDPSDHCETPLEAYEDIAGFLKALADSSKNTPGSLKIYDPYYCAGGVKRRLSTLGFNTVYNEPEDFYANILKSRGSKNEMILTKKQSGHGIPLYDVLLTNPPYSGQHIERLLSFCVSSSKPWAILVPSWVYAKPYFKDENVFFLIPKRGRYAYVAPFEDTCRVTAPFPSIWILGCLPKHKVLTNYFKTLRQSLTGPFQLARSIRDIPYMARTETDPLRSKRPNPKQRKRLKKAAAAAAAALSYHHPG